MNSGKRLTWADVLVGGMLAVLLGTAALAAGVGQREVDNRVRCAANLHQIGLAILLYQNDNQQRYPRTVWNMADPTPTWGTPYAADAKLGPTDKADPFDAASPVQPKPNDVSAALFLLIRTEQIPAAAFTCPSTDAKPFDFGGGKRTAQAWTNWPALAGHLSYSYMNSYASMESVTIGFNTRHPGPAFAVAADLNPGGQAALAATMRMSPAQVRPANSPNQGQDGQNVLYGDGHVDWCSDPFCGTRHDDIYTAGGPEIAAANRGAPKVASTPVDDTDSVLLPTAADLKP
jgi:prepilin-type processing-associated H-X9-DG protein